MPDLDDLLARVAGLERFNRRLAGENKLLKGAGALLAVAAASLVFLGGRGVAQDKKAEKPKEKVVEAEKFLLYDAARRIRAAIWMGKAGPKYDLYDEKGKLRATLALGDKGEPVLLFLSAEGKQQVALNVTGGKRMLTLHDGTGRQRVLLGFLDDGGMLAFSNEKGKTAVGLGETPEGRGLGIDDDNGKKRLSLELEKDKASLKLFDAKEKVLFEKP